MNSNSRANSPQEKTDPEAAADRPLSPDEMDRIEFHRQALALLPVTDDKHPGVATFAKNRRGDDVDRYCTCSVYKRTTCRHILELAGVYKTLQARLGPWGLNREFRDSIWYRLADIIAAGSKLQLLSIGLEAGRSGQQKIVRVSDSHGNEVLTYLSHGDDAMRFRERCGRPPEASLLPNRGAILSRLGNLMLSDTERVLSESGMKSRGQVFEASFWFRLGYHGYMEFGPTAVVLKPGIDEANGNFIVTAKRKSDGASIFYFVVPRKRVRILLKSLREYLPNQNDLAIHPIPLKSIFKVSRDTQLDLAVRPMIKLIQKEGEERFFQREELEKFRYGDLVYVKELGVLAELEPPGEPRQFRSPQRMIIKKYQVPQFLEAVGEDLLTDGYEIDPGITDLKILEQAERVEISPHAIERNWYWLSISYGFGNTEVSLIDILKARQQGTRYINTAAGWVDCQSPAFDALDTLSFSEDTDAFDEASDKIRVSRTDLLRLRAATGAPLKIGGKTERMAVVRRLLDLKPIEALPALAGMTSALRQYQTKGLEWIAFLHENQFGGLLCDDMGLGKTHQAMAFMVYLTEAKSGRQPFLVVCPTTVISHWENKITEHAPGLNPTVYHGVQRDLSAALKDSRVLITSYGILRNDIAHLEKHRFALAIFDEAQNLKNPGTKTYGAAMATRARMKLGLTGTPIENTIAELKALMDLTVPGYLGGDAAFDRRNVAAIEEKDNRKRRKELSRLVAPFTLRRLKQTVLKELPPKIEDIRTCRLSEDQTKLYRDAVGKKGRRLLHSLQDDSEQVPYMHIFALLTLLKQICNHTALVGEAVSDYDRYESGKWELFKELLDQSLGSGQKIVVYSQFLGMIEIIRDYLARQGSDFVVLTGSSRNRGELIARFNDDPDCRVFVGSLKAGGVGIDLVAASVVIHYDRWWNAAREDQATDRVHRIGQQRGVQVFKLVTEGTLEEKISAVIEKKRNLMDDIVKENDPGLLKTFSRNELIDMLRLPLSV